MGQTFQLSFGQTNSQSLGQTTSQPFGKNQSIINYPTKQYIPIYRREIPEIKYRVFVNNKFSHYIPIPKGREYGVPTDFFYTNIAKYYNISPDRISIKNLPRGSKNMMCPVEELDNPDRHILATIH